MPEEHVDYYDAPKATTEGETCKKEKPCTYTSDTYRNTLHGDETLDWLCDDCISVSGWDS